jgi:hypothetical protein
VPTKISYGASYVLYQWFTIWSTVDAEREEKLVTIQSIDSLYLFIFYFVTVYYIFVKQNEGNVNLVNLGQDLEGASMPSIALKNVYYF